MIIPSYNVVGQNVVSCESSSCSHLDTPFHSLGRMPDGVGLAGGGDTRQKGRASLPRVTTIP